MSPHAGWTGSSITREFVRMFLSPIFFFSFVILLIFGYAGSSLLRRLLSSCGKWGLLSHCLVQASPCRGFSCCRARLEGAWVSAVEAHGAWSTSSVVVARRLSYSRAHGIFPDQGLNPCLLHWQSDSLPLSHLGSPQAPSLQVRPSNLCSKPFRCPVKFEKYSKLEEGRFHCHSSFMEENEFEQNP